MSELPVSHTQQRLLDLLGLSSDGSYDMSGRMLAAAGMPVDGVPIGQTWRTVKKMSDTNFLALLPEQQAIVQPVATAAEARGARIGEILATRKSIRDYYNRPFETRDSDESAENDLASISAAQARYMDPAEDY